MSKATEVKDDRRYTPDHEWTETRDGSVVVGITAFAVDQLGEITLVNWDVEEGDTLEAGQVFGTIESVKTLSDLFAPMAGTVKKLNPELETAPEKVNEDCWGAGWMVEIEPADPEATDALMDAAAYAQHIANLDD
jgi:glycine cleavage system H protein